jgi:putative ABC transport system ATP-binding protein
VLGPSGAGKTTVLNILGGMDKCNSGQVIVDEKDVAKYNNNELIKYRRDSIGFVFQFYNLVQNLTALENIELTSQICKDTIPAEEVLASVGLKNRMNNFPSQLSGGEQQRVAIARALAKKPKLLLCDEPTGALDSKTGKKVLEVLQNTCKEYGMTVVIITHNSIIAQMADRVIKMKNGKIEEITINKKPKNIGEINW